MTQELRKLAEAATQGKWKSSGFSVNSKEHGWATIANTEFDYDGMAENAAYIAAANPTAIQALLGERDQLQAKLDAMGKGEPVAWIKYLMGADAKAGGQCYDIVFVACDGYEPLYAAPKALAPLTDEQVHLGQWDDGSGSSADFREGVRFAERKHGIHAKGGQHEDA